MRALALILATLLALPGAAEAQDPDWPALYDVQGVADDDTLAIREVPDAGARILGELPADATGVEVTAPDHTGDWGRVNHGEGTGWVALAYLSRRPGQDAIPRVLHCAGTEPFWSLDLTPKATTFSPVDGTAMAAGRARAQMAEGRADRFSFRAWRQGDGLTGVVARSACSDGMSGRAYGLTLDLLVLRAQGATHYAGCCSLAD
ncbi:peptide-binding protein [Mesobaculum littorinae]|uniref:Peptide-binding protein n=1 Tax=Mesobaculum littorinae TaxID=2486419 RepID=A0A438AGN1_9RHOB|nr:SH3 domain-containing protein [Mesobaculum littorinae]RVV97866.1 peptide-binding protein [Mesobaculum littorinae]